MPFPATPSSFRLSRRVPPSARRNAGPQFARTPRFRLSQTAPLQDRDEDDIDLIDEDATPSHHAAGTVPPQSRNAVHTRREREVIEDADDGELRKGGIGGGDRSNEPVDDTIDSSPSENSQSPGLLDAEFDAVFAPVRESRKRRRISAEVDALSSQGQKPQHDLVLTSSPEQRPNADPSISPDPPPSLGTAVQELAVQNSPAVTMRTPAVEASAPSNTKTPFRSRPRFLFCSTQKHAGSQSAPRSDVPPTQLPPSSPERRKPVFLFPRSPSSSAAGEDIPAPFSPSSRTLHRRGRPRSGVAGYVPGGMAAEVRSWILETGAKREQTTAATTRLPAESTRCLSSDDRGNYLVAARVIQASQGVLSSSGPLAFIKASPAGSSAAQDKSPDSAMNMMIMGPPRSKPQSRQMPSLPSRVRAPLIQPGDLIGIHNGLSWKMELNTDLTEADMPNAGFVQLSPHTSPENEAQATAKEQWLVAMEWDLIQDT